MRSFTPNCFLFLLLLFTGYGAKAQTLPLSPGQDFLTDYLRNQQLADTAAPGYSFCVRPLPMQNSISNLPLSKRINDHLSILPLSIMAQTNSHHPFGWNDGAMIPAKGAQVVVSGGLYAHAGHFILQLQPEIVYAQNLSFQTFPIEYNGAVWASMYQWYNRIDNPERYGENSYQKIFPGQSALYYHASKLAIGVSTENLWWGPGIRNSLVMSNNAPGFAHATIHTTTPIPTRIGSFEFQLIGGQLSNSGIYPPDTNRVSNSGIPLYQPKPTDNRYINGVVFSWQPKWVKGLYIGFSNAAYLYSKDIKSIADVLPLQGISTEAVKQNKKAILGSVFVRYVMPEENAEVYAEYGRNDKAATIVNLLGDKDYPRGYVAGFRKLSNLRNNGSRMEFSAELTQLELPNATLINTAQSWYTHDYVRQGYTHNGKIIGAGIGPGSNSQSIDISWLKGSNKVGLLLERIVRNNDFYYNFFSQGLNSSIGNYSRHWVDLNAQLHAYWKVQNYYVQAEIGLNRSLNYQWWVVAGLPYPKMGYDFLNFHGSIAVVYRL
jgi:hypothetical protein